MHVVLNQCMLVAERREVSLGHAWAHGHMDMRKGGVRQEQQCLGVCVRLLASDAEH